MWKAPGALDDDAVVVLRLRRLVRLAWDMRLYKVKSPPDESDGPYSVRGVHEGKPARHSTRLAYHASPS